MRAVRRLARGPVVILLLTAAFFAFAGIYIGWFGTRWGLLLLVPVVGLALACGLLWSRTLRGEKALEAGASYLALDATGATGAGAPQIPWSGIDRIELVRAAETPLDALPKGSRATVMNAGGTRGSWAIALLDGNEHTGRFDFVPTEEYHRFLITGRDLARAGDAVLLDRQDQP